MMTFVGPKHPVFNIIEAVNKAANVVTGDTPETRHLNISDRTIWIGAINMMGRIGMAG